MRAVSEGRKLYDNMLKYIRFMLVALVTYVVTFLAATIFNIAAGQPFSAVQILWINFLITAPIGIALGLDKETPGLMKRKPRPRKASIMSRPVIITVGLVGFLMSVAIDLVIVFGKDHYDNVAIGSTMGLVAFSLMLVVAAFQCRDQTESILGMETLDNNVVNITVVTELALAVLIARGGTLTSLLGTHALTGRQWLTGAAPAVLLFALWEIGKLIARHGAQSPKNANLGLAASAEPKPADSAAA
ncbi:MAG: cation transporting ATPase C-terminal domain-containing protein [Solirubrobacteraceae bacterium]